MRNGILSRGGKLDGMCRECLVVCWITGTREGLIGDEAGDLGGELISSGQELDFNLMAERNWAGI